VQRAHASLLASNRPDFFRDTFREGLPTSVDQLTWDHPLLLALRDAGIDPAVEYHSIIADRRDPPRGGGTDGVVPYASAHLDGAASELLIHGGHLCQDHPLVIRECRRILAEHLVRIVPRPDGGRAVAPDADPGRRPAHRLDRLRQLRVREAGLSLSDVPLQAIAADVEVGRYSAKPSRVFRFEDIQEAHCVMESNEAKGKMVVVLD
jgi:hypothetical protein